MVHFGFVRFGRGPPGGALAASQKGSATLPANVTWEGVTYPNGALITYNSASSQVTWDVGTIPAGTGVLTPTLTGAFQVSITPAEVERGKSIKLVNGSQFTGMDSFVNNSVDFKIDAMNTDVKSDPTAKFGDGAVR